MSKNEQVVLLHHPCHWEELLKKVGDPLRPFDTEFEEWTFMDDPKYMADPMREVLEKVHERQRENRLKRQSKLLELVDAFDEDMKVIAPKTIKTVELPDNITEKLENIWDSNA